MLLNIVCECHLVQVVLALRAAFEQEFAPVGNEDHFGDAAIAAGQRFDAVDYTDVVMAEDANELLG